MICLKIPSEIDIPNGEVYFSGGRFLLFLFADSSGRIMFTFFFVPAEDYRKLVPQDLPYPE